MELYKATEIANKIAKALEPHCDKIHVAGSIRRQKQEVKDIEIVCIPKRIQKEDLFGKSGEYELSQHFINVTKMIGTALKGKPEGRYMQIDTGKGILLDLFITTQEDYYRQFAIRTGPAEYSHKTIAGAWVKKGWVGTEQGLRKRKECLAIGLDKSSNQVWICKSEQPTTPPAWRSEAEFFEWIGEPYTRPEDRTTHSTEQQ
jgi:DNA polymerase/3'-5' exonuclease PolX